MRQSTRNDFFQQSRAQNKKRADSKKKNTEQCLKSGSLSLYRIPAVTVVIYDRITARPINDPLGNWIFNLIDETDPLSLPPDDLSMIHCLLFVRIF